MRIGISSNTLVAADGRTLLDGIGVYTHTLIQGLMQAQQHVLPIYDGKKLITDLMLPKTDNFPWPFIVSSGLTSLGLATPGQRRISKKIDVYHCTDYHQPNLRHTPVITTLHDAVFLQYPQWCRQGLRQLKNYMMRQAARRAQQVICVSESAKQDVMQYFGIPSDKITVIHHGVADYWRQRLTELEKQDILQPLGINAPFLLFTGTIQPRKNLMRILQAYQQLPKSLQQEVSLVVAGKAAWDQPALELLNNLTQSSQVKWLGHVSHEQLRALYQASQAFVFPSLYEGFGMPVLEAFASGTAVITANTSSLPEVSGDAALLVDPLSVDAINDAMLQLLTDSALRQHYLDLGETRSRQFTWSDCVAKTLMVYQSVR